MEASVRIFHSHVFKRCLLSKSPHPMQLSLFPGLNPNVIFRQSLASCPLSDRKGIISKASLSFNPSHSPFSPAGSSSSLGSNPKNFSFSLSSFQSFDSRFPLYHFNSSLSSPNGSACTWHRASESAIHGGTGGFGDKDRVTTVVLLGWLGAKSKHLRRYVEWYNARGFHALTFMIDPREFLLSVSGRRVEKRVSALAEELISWLSDRTENEKERRLIFHTFSNTGWFVYGAILQILQSRTDLLERIKGCIVDSGGGDPLNPRIWAAGFSAAILKKQISSAYAMDNGREMNETERETGVTDPKVVPKEALILETLLISVLEKFFSVALKFPDVEKLKKIISILTENQPLYPELYLYSSADEVMPYKAVELLIENRKKMGRKVLSYNFGSTPHVDHYRTFPDIYSSQLHNFLMESLSGNVLQMP